MGRARQALQPASWAEDVQTYRQTRGCQAWATMSMVSAPQRPIARTGVMPLANPQHSCYSYQEQPLQHCTLKAEATARDRRHGHGLSGTLRGDLAAVPLAPPKGSRTCSGAVPKNNMFAILQRCDQSGKPDAWFGHHSIDPAAGKRSVPPPHDAKGRKDLFQVLNQAEPAASSSDSWLGHIQVDPSKGKKSCAGPEQRMGRPNLFPVVQQSILRDEDRAAKLVRGADGALTDAWIGNERIDPAKGKLEVGGTACTSSSLAGAALRREVPDTDFEKPGRRNVSPTCCAGHSHHDTVHSLGWGHTSGADGTVKSRRHFGCVPRNCPLGATVRQDLHDVLHGVPVLADETLRNRLRWAEDGAVTRRLPLPEPGASHSLADGDMLHWQAVSSATPSRSPP